MISPPDSAARRRAAGFTLLEMIIVLVVVGAAAGIVMTRGPVRSHALDVRATTADIVRLLRQARGAAIASNTPVTVLVNGEKRTLAVTGGRTTQLPATLNLSAAAGVETATVSKPVAIRFAPNGSSTGGRIQMVDGARRIVVGVDWLTGRISVADAK